MSRIVAHDGNVIQADFRKASFDISIQTQILYRDESVALVRVIYSCDGKPITNLPVQHVTVDLTAS